MIFKWAIKNNNATYNPLENVDKPPERIKTGEGEENEVSFKRHLILIRNARKSR